MSRRHRLAAFDVRCLALPFHTRTAGDKELKWYDFYTVEFEFDSRKSRSNRTKHGIDFEEAQRLWDDPDLVAIPARTTDEPRLIVVGKIGDLHWSVIMTYRVDRLRIISVRRSRKEEVALYEG